MILTSAAVDRAAAVGRILADELAWPMIDQPDLRTLPAVVATTLGRREHLLVVSAPIASRDQDAVRGALHGVRFVDLDDQAAAPEAVARFIRAEFGM